MSGELGLDTVTANQSGKEVTVNLIASELEAAIAGQLGVAGGTTLTAQQMQRLAVIVVTAAGDVTLVPAKRMFGFSNPTSGTVHAIMGSTSLAVAADTACVLLSDGTANGLVMIGGAVTTDGSSSSGGTSSAPTVLPTDANGFPMAKHFSIRNVHTQGGPMCIAMLQFRAAVGGSAQIPSGATVGSVNTAEPTNDGTHLYDTDDGSYYFAETASTTSEFAQFDYPIAKSCAEVAINGRPSTYAGNVTSFDLYGSNQDGGADPIFIQSFVTNAGTNYFALTALAVTAGTPNVGASNGMGISEAPSDGKLYGRKNGAWVEIPTSGGTVPITDPYGAHAYWQLVVTGALSGPNTPANSTQLEISELQFKAAPGGAAIDTTGATMFSFQAAAGVVSTTNTGNYGGYEPSKAFDGDLTTSFISSDGNIVGRENTLGVHFAAVTHVQEITIKSPTTFKGYTGGPLNFDVQYSDDGQAWTTAWSVEDTNTPLVNAGMRTYTSPDLTGSAAVPAATHTDTFGAHKWWQLNITAITGPNGNQTQLEVGDLQFRASPNGAVIPVGTNVAFSFNGATNLNNYAGHEPYRAFDTSTASTFISPDGNINGHSNTLGIEFEKATHVQEVAIVCPTTFAGYTGGPATFDVQYSDDGQAWTTAWTVTDTVALTNGETRVHTAPGLTAV